MLGLGLGLGLRLGLGLAVVVAVAVRYALAILTCRPWFCICVCIVYFSLSFIFILCACLVFCLLFCPMSGLLCRLSYIFILCACLISLSYVLVLCFVLCFVFCFVLCLDSYAVCLCALRFIFSPGFFFFQNLNVQLAQCSVQCAVDSTVHGKTCHAYHEPHLDTNCVQHASCLSL